MEHSVEVSIVKKNGEADTVDVYFETSEFEEFEDKKDKIDFIKEKTIEQCKDIKKVDFGKDELKELQRDIDDISDTSAMHPNESYDEFMEHEDFD